MNTQDPRDRKRVNIRPKVTVLSVLAHLEYKPWYALAEFLDNAIQSFQDHRGALSMSHGPGCRLEVEITVDHALRQVRVRDNAGGIALADFPRAFRPAEIPPDTSGLSEFGMGMKTAACWFAPLWRVRTSALGEPVERTVTFDIDRIVHDQIEELEVEENAVGAEQHYTVIELENVRSVPTGRTSKKIREHLADIYREFIRDEQLVLTYRGDELHYREPTVLVASPYNPDNEPVGEERAWRKDIDFDLGMGQRVRGFAALREKGSTRYAGFSLFRRRRVIEGSADEKYRPREIFGAPNSFVSQRLFGELHLDGFRVSHTKDGFRWDEHEEIFLALLREHLDADEMPLLRQARYYRQPASKAAEPSVVAGIVEGTGGALARFGGRDIQEIEAAGEDREPTPTVMPNAIHLSDREFRIEVDGTIWALRLELSSDPSAKDWLAVAERDGVGGANERLLHVRLGLESEFMRRLVRLDSAGELEPVVRLAAGIGLSEHLARASGVSRAGEIRRNLNRLLSGSLARRVSPEQ